MPPILLAAIFWIGLVALAAALGRRLLRMLSVGPSDPAERAVIGAALGMGALQAIPFILFAIGAGRPAAFRFVLAALAVALVPDLVAAIRAARRIAAGVAAGALWTRVLVGILAGAAAVIFVRAQAPIVDGDALAYHLVAAQRWLDAGRFRAIPTIPYTNWPMSTEALAATMLAVSRDAPLGLIQFTFGLLTTAAAYLLGRRLHGGLAGSAAVVLLAAYPRYTSQFVTLHVELATAAYLTCAALALAGLRHAPAEWRRAASVAAIFAGLAATTKLTGLWAIPLVVLATLPLGELTVRQQMGRATLQKAVGLSIVAPWYIRCWAQTGNPVCPWLYRFLGGAGWSAEGAQRFYYGHRLFCVATALGASPRAMALQHLGMAVLGVAFVVAVAWKTQRSTQAEPARLAAGFAASLAIGGYINSRFFMPALPCMAVCLVGWVRTRERRLAAWICPLAALASVYTLANLLRPSLAESWAFACGRIDRDRWYADYMPEYPVIRYANEHLPPSARVLVAAYEKRISLFHAEALWSDALLQDDIHYGSPARFEADLRRLGVTHLLICSDYLPNCSRNLYCAARQTAEVATQEDLARRRGVLLTEQGPARLYRLDWGEQPPNPARRGATSPGSWRPPLRYARRL